MSRVHLFTPGIFMSDLCDIRKKPCNFSWTTGKAVAACPYFCPCSWRLSSVRKCCFRIQYSIGRSRYVHVFLAGWLFFCCCFNRNINISSIRLDRNVYILCTHASRLDSHFTDYWFMLISLSLFRSDTHTWIIDCCFYWHEICLPYFFSLLGHFDCMCAWRENLILKFCHLKEQLCMCVSV